MADCDICEKVVDCNSLESRTHARNYFYAGVVRLLCDLVGYSEDDVEPRDGRKEVATAGTIVRLSTSSKPVRRLDIAAEHTNSGMIVVGYSTVIAAPATRRGFPLQAGDKYHIGPCDLSKIYLDSTVSGEGVTYVYWL